MFAFLYNPDRFMAFSRWAAPIIGATAVALAAVGLGLDFAAPPDYQQGYTIHVMFIHVPASMMSLFVYACMGVASFLSLIFRQALADAAARAAAPLGAGLTLLALVTGSLWGKPMWGTWWVWDARLTSELVLLLFYLGYMALQAAIDDEARASRACAILALVGVVNLPIVVFSVDWWNTLHQGSTLFAPSGQGLAPVYVAPFLIMIVAYLGAFGSLWLVRIRGEVWRRRANVLAIRAAR
jgi:heme exporter protein C